MRKVSFGMGTPLWPFFLVAWYSGLGNVRAAEADFTAARARMVKQQLAAPDRGITNARVLAVMGKVPRHELVPATLRSLAYADRPLPIGHDQTI